MSVNSINNNNNSSQLSSHDKLKINQIFHNYKPICDELITVLSNTDEKLYQSQDSKEILVNLEYLLQSLIDITNKQFKNENDSWSMNYIFDYLMIPLSLIINSNNNDTTNTINSLSINNQKVLFCIQKDSIQLKSFTLLSHLLTKLKIIQFKKFINLLTVLINYLNKLQQQSQDKQQDKPQPSLLQDEFYNIILLNIRLLFGSTQESFFNIELYTKHPFLIGDQFVPFGYTISTILNLLTLQQLNSRDVKKELINTLDYIIEPFSKRNLQFYTILFQIFPGVISTLFKVISGDYKLGSILKINCLQLFSKIISSTLSDKVLLEINKLPPAPTSNKDQIKSMFKESELNLHSMFCLLYPTSSSYSGLRLQHSLYNQSTINSSSSSSSSSSSPILTSKLSLEKYQNREAIIKSAFKILSNCLNLTSLTPILIEVLVLFYNDDYPQISNQTKQYMLELKQQQSTLDINSILQDNFNHLFKSLSMLICCNNDGGNGSITSSSNIDEEKKCIVLKLVISYLSILENEISSLFSTRIDMIASTLISLVSMKSPPPQHDGETLNEISKNLSLSLQDSLKIVSDNPFDNSSGSGVNQKSRNLMSFSNLSKPFLNFYSQDIEKQLIKMIQLIGKFSDIRDWIDILLSNNSLSISPKRKEILFCLNHILIGNSSTNNNNHTEIDFSTIQYILDEILQPNLLNLKISKDQEVTFNNNDSASGTTNQLLSISVKDTMLEQYFDNTITVSLILDTIGILANVVPSSSKYRQIFLSKIIYQVLEKFGLSSVDSSGMILKSCRTVFDNLMNSFKFESIQDLIYKNSDYLLDTIESHMKYLDSFPNTPNIFQGILNITGLGFLPFLSDTVTMILNSLDLAIENSKNIQIFISILYNIVSVLYNNSKHQLQYQQIISKLNSTKSNNNIEEEKENETNVENEQKQQQSIQDIKEFFTTHHSNKDKEPYELYSNGGDNSSGGKKKQQQSFTNNSNVYTPESLNIPNFIETTEIQRQMVQNILHKCIHFIGSKNKTIKMTTIDIIEMGLVIVATGTRKYGGVEEDDQKSPEILNEDDHEQQTAPIKPNSDKSIERVALFPLIHLVWDSLVKRVSESDRIIGKKSLQVIQTISNLSLDFITQRFWDQLWPIINKILIEEQQNNIKQQQYQQYVPKQSTSTSTTSTTTTSKQPLIIEIDDSIKSLEEKETKIKKDQQLKYTPSFKVQFVILQTLKTILTGSDAVVDRITQKQIMEIAKTTIYYLNRNQPEQFQQFTIEIWRDALLKNDPDSLWLLLFNLSNQCNDLKYQQVNSLIISPIPNFEYSPKDCIDFKSNALLLFNLIN